MIGRKAMSFEDDPAIIDVLHEFIQVELGIAHEGILTKDYETLKAGVARVKAEQPDVVTLDIRLGPHSPDQPDLGYQALSWLNADPATRWIRKIVITGEVDPTKRYRILRHYRANDIVEKPVDLGELRIALEQAFQDVDSAFRISDTTHIARIVERVYQSQEPSCFIELDWMYYAKFLKAVGDSRGEAAKDHFFTKVDERVRQEDKRFIYFRQVGRSDGGVIVCRPEAAMGLGRDLVTIFHAVVDPVLSPEALRTGYTVAEIPKEDRNGNTVLDNNPDPSQRKPVMKVMRLPRPHLSQGINSNVWFVGRKHSFAEDDPDAWQLRPDLVAPRRKMFYPHLVRDLAIRSREAAEVLGKAHKKCWASVHNSNPFFGLEPHEQSEQLSKTTSEKQRLGKPVLEDRYGEIVLEGKGNG